MGVKKAEEIKAYKGMGYPRKIPRTAVNEIFESVQGEGALMGYATLFVRFQGCQNINCRWCDSVLEGTLIKTADKDWVPIEKISIGYNIIGIGLDSHPHNKRYGYVKAETTHIESHVEKEAIELSFSNGSKLTTTLDHEIFSRCGASDRKGNNFWEYKKASCLNIGDEFWSIGIATNYSITDLYINGWLKGYDEGDGGWSNERKTKRRYDTIDLNIFNRLKEFHDKFGISYSVLTSRMTVTDNIIYRLDSFFNKYAAKEDNSEEFNRGFVAGFFDAEGSNSTSSAVFSNKDTKVLRKIKRILKEFSFDNFYIKDGIGCSNLIVNLPTPKRFLFDAIFQYAKKHNEKWLWGKVGVRGGITHKKMHMAKDIITLTNIKIIKGKFKFYDIGSSSDNFIANGIVVHNSKKTWPQNDKRLMLSVDLLEKIYSLVNRDSWICFTGGEPLQQLKSLMWLVYNIHNNEYKKLSIETSGVIGYDKNNVAQFPDQKEVYDMYNDDVFFSISPKLFGALGKRFNYEELRKIIKFWMSLIDLHFRYQFKFVASCDEDFEALSLVHEDFEMDCNMFLQIEASKLQDKEFIAKCFKFVKEHHKYRMVIQQHKVLNMQ